MENRANPLESFSKDQVRDFFDALAQDWDQGMIRNQRIIDAILDAAGIGPGMRVLDVGCGTGALLGDYLARGAAAVTGVDLSPEMIRVAKSKFSDPRVTLLAADIESIGFSEPFHCCVVYNAFPHFPQPGRLIACLAKTLAIGGRLTIAHGMSRAKLDRHHSGSAQRVSVGLMHEDALAELFAPFFQVDVKISDGEKYIVSGIKEG